jgi:plastocyanin
VRLRVLGALGGLALAATALGSTANPGAHASGAPAVGAVSVSASEFELTLSRAEVDAGRVRVQLINRGEDDHDLQVSSVDGSRSWRYPVTGPGEVATRTLPLAAGRYRLICSLEGHEALGMRAALRVRRPPASG